MEDLDRELLDRTNALHEATANLADARAWLAQRRRTGLAQQQALVGYQLAIKKIGKGTGKLIAKPFHHKKKDKSQEAPQP